MGKAEGSLRRKEICARPVTQWTTSGLSVARARVHRQWGQWISHLSSPPVGYAGGSVTCDLARSSRARCRRTVVYHPLLNGRASIAQRKLHRIRARPATMHTCNTAPGELHSGTARGPPITTHHRDVADAGTFFFVFSFLPARLWHRYYRRRSRITVHRLPTSTEPAQRRNPSFPSPRSPVTRFIGLPRRYHETRRWYVSLGWRTIRGQTFGIHGC